jgi:ABC-type branched-subunit amino acid transport system substrate-binding protein
VLAAYDPYSPAPPTRAFMDAFAKTYAALPSQVAVFTHDFFFVLQQAMAAGATRDTLIAKVKSMKIEAAGGAYAWDKKGDVKGRTFAVVEVKGGKFTSTGLGVDETGLEKIRT